MNIQTVAANLRNTIAGKEKLLEEYQKARKLATMAEDLALYATSETLKINIDELKRILGDVEQCAKQASADSWVGEVDRQGGSFTAEELDPNRGWQ